MGLPELPLFKPCTKFIRSRKTLIQPLDRPCSSIEHAEELAEFNDLARKVCDAFSPGALTIVLPKKQCVPGEITAGGNTVALRSLPIRCSEKY